jgi:hypothetical protein
MSRAHCPKIVPGRNHEGRLTTLVELTRFRGHVSVTFGVFASTSFPAETARNAHLIFDANALAWA